MSDIEKCQNSTIHFFVYYDQLNSFAISGQFIFSIWDGDRTFRDKDGDKQIKKSSKLAWPIDMKNCKRNCQDCGMAALKEIGKKGFTTGTKCITKHASMKVS